MAGKVSQMMKKGLIKSVISNDKHGARLANMYTGKKINGAIAPMVLGGAIMAGGGLGRQTNNPQSMSEVNPLNAMSLVSRNVPPPTEQVANPYTLADGTAGQAPTLGTNGSMVFGMHNKKQGGYL